VSVRKRRWTTATGESKEAWLVAYRDSEGDRAHKTFARKKDADAYHAKVTMEVAAGMHTSDSRSITVREAGQQWLTSREQDGVERATLVNYREYLELHIAPLIGAKKLTELTVPAVRTFKDRLREANRSPAMVKKILVSLSAILADAQDRGYINQNVAHQRRGKNNRIDARAKPRLEAGRDIPTPAEISAIIATLTGPGRTRPLLLTAIFTGLRASELRGLTWANTDLARGEIRVTQRADRFGVMGAPKSTAGRRSVPLPPLVINALKEWKLKSPSNTLDLVFPGDREVLALTTIVQFDWWPVQLAAAVVDAEGKAKYSGFHSLRHFFASWCINRRADGGRELPIKVVQGLLGHASIQMTADRYGHLFPRSDDSAELAAAERALMAVV
jgi:integrase